MQHIFFTKNANAFLKNYYEYFTARQKLNQHCGIIGLAYENGRTIIS